MTVNDLPDYIANALWPGATGEMETLEVSPRPRSALIYHQPLPGSGQTTRELVITRLTLQSPDTPFNLTYTYKLHEGVQSPDTTLRTLPIYDGDKFPQNLQASITVDNFLEAKPNLVKQFIKVFRKLQKGGVIGGPSRHDYTEVYKRLQANKDWTAVKAEFLQRFNVSSDAFNNAMYRRRQKDKK